MTRVVVVSPLPAIRAGLRALIGLADDLEVVGEADLLDLGGGGAPAELVDVVVVDAEPGLDVGNLAAFGRGDGAPRLVVLGPVVADRRLAAELAGRAWGYVSREAGGDRLVSSVRAVAAGLLAIDPTLGHDLIAPADLGADGSGDPPGLEDLTAREREVLQLVALGLANKMIANRLEISEHTVKFHVASILAKLGAGSRTEAVHLAARRGLVAL